MSSEAALLLLAGILLALIAGILLWAWRFPLQGNDVATTLRNGLGRAGFLAAAVVVLLLALPRAGAGAATGKPGLRQLDRLGPFVPVLLLLVLWLDVRTHEPQQNPSVPPWIYAPGLARAKLAMTPQPELGGSRAMMSPATVEKFTGFIMSDLKDNFLVKRLGYFADCNLLDGVPKVDGFFSLYPAWNSDLTSVLYGSTNASFPRLTDFMGVSQITAPGKVVDWMPRPSAMPLVTIGQQPVFADERAIFQALFQTNLDFRRMVCLPLEARGTLTATQQTAARVLDSRFANQSVSIQTEAPAASLVVISQTYYPAWKAYVDGRPAKLWRANYAFQALQVPAGRHQIRLVYEDKKLLAGAVLSGMGLLACAGLWWRGRFRISPASCRSGSALQTPSASGRAWPRASAAPPASLPGKTRVCCSRRRAGSKSN